MTGLSPNKLESDLCSFTPFRLDSTKPLNSGARTSQPAARAAQAAREYRLRFHAGQQAGIVGRDATGKASLFALIPGALDADAGDPQAGRQLDIATMRQHTPAGARSAIEFMLDGDTDLRDIQRRLAVAEREAHAHALADLHARRVENIKLRLVPGDRLALALVVRAGRPVDPRRLRLSLDLKAWSE